MLYRQSNFCTSSIKCSMFQNNYDEAAILKQCGIFLGGPGRPKVVSIKILMISVSLSFRSSDGVSI